MTVYLKKEMKYKTIITISGRISSGKSLASQLIHKEFSFPITSFGTYLYQHCQKNNLSTDRENLQKVGSEMILTSSSKFLQNVLSYGTNSSDSIILEGVRHTAVLEEVKQLAAQVISVFVDAPQQIRFERYCQRRKNTDSIMDYDHFKLLDNHPVELEIDSLHQSSSVIIDNSRNSFPESNLLTSINRQLKIF